MTDVESSRNEERLKFRLGNTSERIPHRSSTSKRELLSFVARTSTYESVAQEHFQKSSVVLQKTTKSALLLSLMS